MELTDEIRAGLGTALNDAILVSVHVDAKHRTAWVTLAVLMLPEDGPPPADPRILLRLFPVGRVAASLRRGGWNDAEATVEQFALEELPSVVESFVGQPIYGWEFFDVREQESAEWLRRLSLDVEFGQEGREHSVFLFQEGSNSDLDLLIWFDEIEVQDSKGRSLPFQDLIASGERWWKAFRAQDPRTMTPQKTRWRPLQAG